MPSVVTVVDDYIESLLRDACIRIGLYPARTKALEWGKLLSTDKCNDNAQLVENIKKATYVVHCLLNAKKLTDSFSKYFEKRTDMSFNENNVALTDEKGSMTLKVFSVARSPASRPTSHILFETSVICQSAKEKMN